MMATKGPLRRWLAVWMPCANSYLPVPVSPTIRMLDEAAA